MRPPMERIKRRGEKSPGLTSGICQYLEAGEEREACKKKKKSMTKCEAGGIQECVP